MKKYRFLSIMLASILLTGTPIAAAVVSHSTTSETTVKKTLTLEDAINSALALNNQLSLNTQESEVLSEKLKYSDDISTLAYQQLYVSFQQNAQKRDFLIDNVRYNITSLYNTIVLLQEEISSLNLDIELQNLKLKTLAKQKDLGLITELQYQGARLELNTLNTNLVSLQQSLDSNSSNFKILTNKSLSDYELVNSITLNPFNIPQNIESYFKSKVSIYLKYQKELVSVQDTYILDNFIIAPTYAEYLSAKFNINNAALTLEDTADSLLQALLKSYTSLLSLESQINMLTEQSDYLQKQLEVSKVKYNLGLMTKLDLLTQENSYEDLKYNRLSLINQYNMLAEMLQKPWLMSN